MADESTDHLFRYCPVFQEIWSELHIADKISNTDLRFDHRLFWTFDTLSEPKCKLFCCALWSIWRNRNLCVHEKRLISGKDTAVSTFSYIGELDALERRTIPNTGLLVKWVAPVGNVIKINFDGAFDTGSSRSASGVVAKNNVGKVLKVRTIIHANVSSAFAAEANACLQALHLALTGGWSDITVEGDALSVIKKCQSSHADRSHIGAIIQDIQQLKVRFDKVNFQFIPRSANTLAHILATTTLKEKRVYYLVDLIPECAIRQTVADSVREPD